MKEIIRLILFCYFLIQCISLAADTLENKLPQMLAKNYQEGLDVRQYWVSEKLDGIRARWDGHRLISKNGYEFSVPSWFTRRFPKHVMDGELWIEHNRYEETSSITSRQSPDNRWSKIKFMLFDLPQQNGDFSARLSAMQQIVDSVDSPYLSIIRQFRVGSENELMLKLNSVVNAGGEGLMLHHQASLYINGRSEHLLKLKIFDDAEATVIAYKPGKGQFAGMMGSIKVRNEQGNEFFIGSGFNKQQRENPPKLNSLVTYKHQGLTKNDIPRFPVFIRVRDEK